MDENDDHDRHNGIHYGDEFDDDGDSDQHYYEDAGDDDGGDGNDYGHDDEKTLDVSIAMIAGRGV